jgi:GNAT superfamily N-acetyltransferase
VAARFATSGDVGEVVRLAGVMYASVGQDISDPRWISAAEGHFRSRLGADVQVVVVDHPDGNRLAASGAAVIVRRLPAPHNPGALVAYIQWVATDEDMRRQGLCREVMRLLLDWCAARGAPIVELHATPDGEALYRSLGFGQRGPIALRRREWDT